MTAGLVALLLGATPLKVGDPAPDFTLPDTDGAPVTLSALLRNGPVVLAFYPKAFTPGCTQQNTNFGSHATELFDKGAQILGISTDTVETQRKFREKLKLPYPLLSDRDGAVSAQYPGKMPVIGLAKRANFVIGQDGKIKAIIEGGDAVDPSTAIAQCPLRAKGG